LRTLRLKIKPQIAQSLVHRSQQEHECIVSKAAVFDCLKIVLSQNLTAMNENQLSKIVYDSSLKIHKKLGPGLLENAYEECLYYELTKQGLHVQKQKPLPLIYEEVRLNVGYRVDIMVENKLIVEVKAVEGFHNVHFAQVLTYLKLSGCKLGLLINFNVALITTGITRIVNRL
jgi:GxxExxY protein